MTILGHDYGVTKADSGSESTRKEAVFRTVTRVGFGVGGFGQGRVLRGAGVGVDVSQGGSSGSVAGRWIILIFLTGTLGAGAGAAPALRVRSRVAGSAGSSPLMVDALPRFRARGGIANRTERRGSRRRRGDREEGVLEPRGRFRIDFNGVVGSAIQYSAPKTP